MKKITLRLLIFYSLFISTNTSFAQIYSNGTLSTGTNSASATAAPTGYTWSEMQANTGNTTEVNSSFGYGAFYNNALTTNLRIADDFTVPTGQSWNVTNIDFFCYQTSFAGTIPPIDVIRVQIYNGDPQTTGTLIVGDMTTNIYDASNSGEAFMYRISNTVIPATAPTGTARKIWKVKANLTTTLSSGNYWIVFQIHATNDASVFMPPVTIIGSRGATTANAKQLTVSGPSWAPLLDLGNPTTAPDVNQDMPFIINGAVVLKDNEFEKSTNFILQPNPINDNFQIISNNIYKFTSIEIIDSVGRVVKTILPLSENEISINCSDLQTGNYLVKIKSNDGIEIKKIIKN